MLFFVTLKFGITCLKQICINQLELVDKTLLRRIFETGVHTPKVMLYLELGIYPIRFVIRNRRVMYLHNILTNKQSLQYRVFQAQLKSPCKGDWTWTSTVSNDLCELGITLTHQEISRMSKEKFQNFLKEKIKKRAFEYLIAKKEKNKERSKVKDVNYTNLEIQPYLLPNSLSKKTSESIQLCRFIFSLRCRMLQVRENYNSSYVSLAIWIFNRIKNWDKARDIESQPNLHDAHQPTIHTYPFCHYILNVI